MKSVYKFLKNKKTLDIIGSELKQGNRYPGVALGPDTLRAGGLSKVAQSLDWVVNDKGNIRIEDINMNEIEHIIKKNDISTYKSRDLVANGLEIGAMNYELYKSVKQSALEKNFPLILGGDHSIASGSITALREVYPNMKIIWVDAHVDINTPELSLSVNYHGMPVSHLLGLTKNGDVPGFDWLKSNVGFKDIAYIGLRDVDPAEKKILRDYNIKNYDMDAVTEKGIGRVMHEIFEYFKADAKTDNYPIHISFDIDGVDNQFVKQTGTIARGGLNSREANYLIRKTAQTQQLVSMDLVELNPELGSEEDKKIRPQEHGDDPLITGTETTCFSLELIRSALGHTLV